MNSMSNKYSLESGSFPSEASDVKKDLDSTYT